MSRFGVQVMPRSNKCNKMSILSYKTEKKNTIKINITVIEMSQKRSTFMCHYQVNIPPTTIATYQL